MPRRFSDFTDQFFWSFKRMDNVNYNFEIVCLLYKSKKENSLDIRFNKPIIVFLMAIVECMLYDFVDRIQTHTNDSFPNITQSIISHFRNAKDSDELKILIPRLQSQNLLRANKTDSIYKDLEDLRKVRNRLHIQNKYNLLDKDENKVFTNDILNLAEKTFEKVCEILCNVYPRWKKQPLPMSDFPRPWT